MANFIEELYYGNIDPQAHGYRPKSPVKNVSGSLNTLEEKLTEQLDGENKELFLCFCNAYAEFMGECELDTFITGFRLGARFVMDTFLSDEAPFAPFNRLMRAIYSKKYVFPLSLTPSYSVVFSFLLISARDSIPNSCKK